MSYRDLSKQIADAVLSVQNPSSTTLRKKANRELLDLLENYLELNPDIRFNQALYNLEIVLRDLNTFMEEPELTLKRAKEFFND